MEWLPSRQQINIQTVVGVSSHLEVWCSGRVGRVVVRGWVLVVCLFQNDTCQGCYGFHTPSLTYAEYTIEHS